MQPFKNPVCTPEGTIFDVEVIGAWLDKHPNQNPVDGEPLDAKDLIKLNFSRNSEDDQYVDPVTYKPFTDNTHIVAIRHGTYANAFSWDTVQRMNIKEKNWVDLLDDQPFTRADIITLQDPHNAAARNLDSFKYLKDGGSAQLTPEQEAQRAENINASSLGSMGDRVLKAKAAVEKARKARETGDVNRSSTALSTTKQQGVAAPAKSAAPAIQEKKLAANAASYTTGKAAASFTSTGLTPDTSGERAMLTDEQFMLHPKRVKQKGYARIETNLGDLTLELHTDVAPKAVWNFIRLAEKDFYKGVAFHRNIPGFMIQGGDPSGTGKGGESIWKKNFDDEFSHLTHDARGTLSMANKGKNTNSSQFFITYKATPHLDRKHTIFGTVHSGMDVLNKMEEVPTDGSNRPLNKIVMKNVVVFVDPFAEFLANRDAEKHKEQAKKQDDEQVTWTGKRLDGKKRAGEDVGKYLQPVQAGQVDEWEGEREPPKKKAKSNGFNFDNW